MSTESVPNRILVSMLDRLYAAIVSGPSINCRPSSSRLRVDLAVFERLADMAPGQILAELLSERGAVKIAARVPAPPQRVARPQASASAERPSPDEEPDEVRRQRKAHGEQQALLSKLRILAEESQTYQQDTGAHVLYVGYPLLSMQSGGGAASARVGGRQILAPIAFIPVDLVVRTGLPGGVEIRCREDEVDRVIPNESLLAWVERQTGRESGELFADDQGQDPRREIRSICEYVTKALGLELPAFLSVGGEGEEKGKDSLEVQRVASGDQLGEPCVLASAVLGLFPTSKQGLLRDTKAMIAGAALAGPVGRFLHVVASSRVRPAAQGVGEDSLGALPSSQRRLVTQADPCQARAVAMARESEALVIHGPPGTGKSQTITNIIADHLARGERVLFVCDKRTALDVVANRLEHLGLGSLCALVHDAQRDQRELYRSIREQIEGLADTKVPATTERQLAGADTEISAIHAELTRLRQALMGATASGGDSIHELVGKWLGATLACLSRTPVVVPLDAALLRGATAEEYESRTIEIRSLLKHAASCGYWANPWAGAIGVTLQAFLAMPMEGVRAKLGAALAAAGACDATAHASIPAFVAQELLETQAKDRERLLEALARAMGHGGIAGVWLAKDGEGVRRASKLLAEVSTHLERLKEATLDPELVLVVRERPPSAAQLAASITALEAYLTVARSWHSFVHLGKRGAAKKVLGPLGFVLSPEAAERARDFLSTLRAALVVRSVLDQFEGRVSTGLPDVVELVRGAGAHADMLGLLRLVDETASLRPLRKDVVGVLGGGGEDGFLDGLRRSRCRAEAIGAMESELEESGLFAPKYLDSVDGVLRSGGVVSGRVGALAAGAPGIENVLRVREGVAGLPGTLQGAMGRILAEPVDVEAALLVLRQGVLAAETRGRIEGSSVVATLDGHRVQALIDRWRELDGLKHTLVRDSVMATWVGRQRSRLLAATGSRLNSEGAELRRRVSSRGTHALRLRQVLELGRGVEGGDPLLDLRPVWMASPETVAQIFGRESTFDIVVFDEASQCRLEEALPVIMRARRVVIAGDPKQLPPSRFFEDSSLAESNSDDIETDQDLFEQQQSEVEDLLSASLNLDLQQTYLDVHYRSRNADLIAFSNEQFYGSRLQPIPGHPANRTRYAPLTLYNVGGVYEDRTNLVEAEQVVKIVRDLLRRAQPPSIGVGCFNVAQRDLIVERLDEAAAADSWFAGALAAARVRRGEGSFEGLFVKNLENVQGDERDHIIISTTYGPDPSGKFYRRFGPLAMPGGGRRLNVLVTRARCEVHLVSSIPPAVYRSLPPVEQGQTPGGGWLLFSYLNYAERLARLYELAHLAENADVASTEGEGAAQGAGGEEADAREQGDSVEAGATLRLRESRSASVLAASLGRALVERAAVGGTVHWGNEGFCVDIAMDHPTRADDVTIGVLTDFSRFDLAGDHVEWDSFSTAVLRDQGWALHRVWSPAIFRDLQGSLDSLAEKAAAEGAKPRKEAL